MRREAEIDAAYAGDDDLSALVPRPLDTAEWRAWLARNRHGRNELRRAVHRLVAPLAAAQLQWTGDENWTDTERDQARPRIRELEALVPLLARDLILKGKTGILAWRDQHGRHRTSLLSGFLHPVWDDLDTTALARLVVFQPYLTDDARRNYLVWDLQPGLVTIHSRVSTPTEYPTRPGHAYPQDHAPDRVPAAFTHWARDPNRATEGLAEAALGAHRQHQQRLVQENASYERAGVPQRTVSGDDIDETSVQSYNAFQTIVLPENARLEYPAPTLALEQLSRARRDAARDVSLALHAPDPSDGAGESGEARLVSQEELVQTTTALGRAIARALTDGASLMAALGALPGPLEIALGPELAAQRARARQDVTAYHQAGLIGRHEALRQLRALGVPVSDDELARARLERENQPAGEPA